MITLDFNPYLALKNYMDTWRSLILTKNAATFLECLEFATFTGFKKIDKSSFIYI